MVFRKKHKCKNHNKAVTNFSHTKNIGCSAVHWRTTNTYWRPKIFISAFVNWNLLTVAVTTKLTIYLNRPWKNFSICQVSLYASLDGGPVLRAFIFGEKKCIRKTREPAHCRLETTMKLNEMLLNKWQINETQKS